MDIAVGDIVEDRGTYFLAEEDEAGLFFLVPLIGVGVRAAAKAAAKHGIQKAKKKALDEADTRPQRQAVRADARTQMADARQGAKVVAKGAKTVARGGAPATGFIETAIGLTGEIGRVDPHPVKPHPSRMRVVLNTHGGQEGLADVMEGLVQRNVRSIRAGTLPRAPKTANFPEDRIWRDAVTASRENIVSPCTLVAWKAAEQRVYGQDPAARVCFESGRPAYVTGVGDVVGFVRSPSVRVAHDHGRSNEYMVLAIDDSSAYAVRDVNTAIARHNAKRMISQGLPLLYESGVRYQTEGSPELWWDAEEILAHGHDDCEGLAAYRAGELINAGHDASVYTRLIQGPASSMGGSARSRLFHAVTKTREPDGSVTYDDPSAVLGMPVPRWYLDHSEKMRAAGRPI